MSLSASASNSPSPSPSPGAPIQVYTREQNGTLPSTKTDLSTRYTTIEEGEVYLNDGRRVALSGAASAYLMHLFKKANDNRKDRIKVRIDLQTSLAPTLSTVYLQMWNGRTNAWETMDSNALKSANEDFSLYADVTDTEYYDFRESAGEVAVRVYQLNNSGASKILSIDLVQISFIHTYRAKYNATGNRYREKYVSHKSKYRSKYPHKNPQDDNDII